MVRVLSLLFNGTRTAIQVGACLLIGFMMVFAVGIPLAIGGRPEALVPIGLGSLAFATAAKDIARVAKSGL
ncbi:MAG: hypothetical protein AAFZ74_07790 [Pseudomonadota bacterium]